MPEAMEITALLAAYADGDRDAFDQAVARIYPELRRLAHGQRRPGLGSRTLDTTAIVHEAYLKLVGSAAAPPRDRGHFLAVAATAMRQVAVDHARTRRRGKRGGDRVRVELGEADAADARQLDQILAVNRALERLADDDPRLVHVVECRYFAGMSEAETATALGLSRSTVQRAWLTAKRQLRRGLGPDTASTPAAGGEDG